MKKLVLVALLSVGSSFSFEEDLTIQTTGLVKNVEPSASLIKTAPSYEGGLEVILRNRELFYIGDAYTPANKSAKEKSQEVLDLSLKGKPFFISKIDVNDAAFIFKDNNTNAVVVINGFLDKFSTKAGGFDSTKFECHLEKRLKSLRLYLGSSELDSATDEANNKADFVYKIISTNDKLAKQIKHTLEIHKLNNVSLFENVQIETKNSVFNMLTGKFSPTHAKSTGEVVNYENYINIEKKEGFFNTLKGNISNKFKSKVIGIEKLDPETLQKALIDQGFISIKKQ